jgi:alkanesulfonate monooxygenase SsuD/methylene tetrahydromethanopterin reductase-like flavin-dependent oxidoreductase (luciferase family)
MSLNLNPAYVASHWDSVEAGARRSRPHADRRDWRLVREVFVAETGRGGVAPVVGLHDGPDDGRVLPEAARELRLPRLPEAQPRGARQRRDGGVLRQAQLAGRLARDRRREAGEVYEEVGGFGQILVFGFDYAENPEALRTSLGLLQTEVLPRVRHLVPKPALAAAE